MLHFPSPFSGGEGLLGHSSSRCTFLGWCSMFERFTRIGHRWRSLKGLIFLKCRYEPWDFDNEVLEFLLFESWCGVLPIRLVVSPSGIGIKIVIYGKIRNPLNLQNTKNTIPVPSRSSWAPCCVLRSFLLISKSSTSTGTDTSRISVKFHHRLCFVSLCHFPYISKKSTNG